MPQIITIDIINNDKGGHDDLLFSIPDLIGDMRFDTYYFRLAIEPIETIYEIRNAVSVLLQFWLDKLAESKNGESIFLPIDFSDEYTGCLKVQNKDSHFILTYGFSRRPGYAVGPLNPENYHKEINDFQADEKQLAVNQEVFINALDQEMQKLKSV